MSFGNSAISGQHARAMDLKHLRTLLAIAETGSVTKAAELIHLVQPAVSRQLKLLEEEIGTPLFARERHGMELTEAGRTLADHARRALRELERAKAEIKPVSGAVSGLVHVGLLPSTCDLIAGDFVAGLKREYPAIHLRVSTGYAGHLQQWLERGEVDLAMLYNLQPTAAISILPVLEETLYLVGLPDTGLRTLEPQPLSSLRGKPLILPSAPHGIRTLVEHACALAHIPLHVVAEADAMSLQKTFVLHGLGYTVLPSAAILDDLARGTIAAAPLSRPPMRRRIVLALPAGSRISIAVRCVVDALAAQMRKCISDGRWPGAQLLATTQQPSTAAVRRGSR